MDDYLEAFVREGEEHVTALNNALLELESDPTAEEAMDRIFRTAHTLKGNFGAMGFESASSLAHAIEDLLDAMRQGEIEVTAERMDHVFAGIDEVEACLSDIEESGEPQRDVSATIDDLRGVLESARAADDSPADAAVSTRTNGDVSDLATILEYYDVERLASAPAPVYSVRVSLAETEMAGVDAMFVLEGLEAEFDVLDTRPDREAIEDGAYEDDFAVAVATAAADLEETVASMGRVDSVDVTDLTDAVDTSATDRPAESDGTATEDDGDKAADDDPGTATDDEPDTATDDEPDTETVDSGTATDDHLGTATDDEPGMKDGDPGTKGDAANGSEQSTTEIQTVRVDVDQLDELHGLVEQLVTTRIKLRRSVGADDRRAQEELDELDKISSSLQDTVMDMRLVPMTKIVGKFPRLVRDLAREEGKQVDFETEGDDVELDRTILTEISDPLMHLLRNAVDHGIESPEAREASDKDPTGQITLAAERERDTVRISVSDDGAGIDPERLRSKAVEKDVLTRSEAAEMDDAAVPELVFEPGFSTNEEVTDVSGRGVGMDVVKDTVDRLDGQVSIESEPGEGTTITLELPVTVAIVTVLFVVTGEEEYGIPIKSVDEIGRMQPVKIVDGQEVVTYGDDVFPLIRLGDALDVPGATENGEGMLVKIRESERRVAIHCDGVRSQEEVVVKPFEGILSGIPGLSGAAVLGEGEVVTILDVGTI